MLLMLRLWRHGTGFNATRMAMHWQPLWYIPLMSTGDVDHHDHHVARLLVCLPSKNPFIFHFSSGFEKIGIFIKMKHINNLHTYERKYYN